ncbi:cupin domain-containing protein [Streptomyces sp. 8L]|uniref:cupin domain-containing protein n=1 Tax=Streptomyces sp. 8L TaxID=2877242 RepID=UPI0035A8B68F
MSEEQAYDLSVLAAQQDQKGERYMEFLRVEDMSAGLYVLPAGGTDPQTPHAEDELYHVLAGRAVLRIGTREQPVEAGSVVYVPARVDHRFHSVTEDLRVLVLFAPSESQA